MQSSYNVYLKTTSIGIGVIITRIYGNTKKQGVAWGFLKHYSSEKILKQKCQLPADIEYLDLEEALYTLSKDFINSTFSFLHSFNTINDDVMPKYNINESVTLNNPAELFSLCWHNEDIAKIIMGTISPDTKLYDILSYFCEIIPQYKN